MKYVILLILLILPIKSYADIACGTTINASGTYTLTANKTCNETWITITASGVTVDLGGYSVSYGNTTKPVNGAVTTGGIIVSNSNAVIKNGTLTQGAMGGHGVFSNTNSVTGLDVNHLTVNINLADSKAVLLRDISAVGVVTNITDNIVNVSPTSGESNGIDIGSSNTIIGSIARNTINMGSGLNTGRPCGISVGLLATSDNRFAINNNTINIYGTYTNGIRSWGSTYLDVYSNTLNMYGDNVKGIQIDGGTEFSLIRSNTINMQTTGVVSQSYGIRTRFGADDNEFYLNTCDSSAASNSICIDHGQLQASAPSDTPKRNIYHNNTLTGISPLIEWDGEHEDTESYDNTITSTDNGVPVLLFAWGTSSNFVDGLTMTRDAIITTNQHVIKIQTEDASQPLVDVVFDAVTRNGALITSANINDTRTNYPGGWTITSTDYIAPTTTPNKSGRYTSSQLVTLTPSETATTLYCVSFDSTPCTPSITYTAPIKFMNRAFMAIYYSSTDAANNVEAVKKTELRRQRRK